jgi:hypothetical protein
MEKGFEMMAKKESTPITSIKAGSLVGSDPGI